VPDMMKIPVERRAVVPDKVQRFITSAMDFIGLISDPSPSFIIQVKLHQFSSFFSLKD
jgi:hypothetical protein